MTLLERRPVPGEASVADATSVLTALVERGVRFAVLRRRDVSGGESGPGRSVLEILVDPEHMPRLDGTVRDMGLAASDESVRSVRSYGGSEYRMEVRCELTYGRRAGSLSTSGTPEEVLDRACCVGGVPTASAGDRFIHHLLQCLLDEGSITPRSRVELRALMEELRSDPQEAGRACERVQRELAPAVPWGELLADIVLGRWDDLVDRGRALRVHLWRRAPVASTARQARGILMRTLGHRARRGPPRDRRTARSSGPPPGRNTTHGREQIRGSGLLLGGRGLSTGLKFLAELLIVRYLSTTDYGAWTYALAAVVFLRGFATLGLNRAIVRFLPIHLERGDRERFFGVTALVLGGLLTASATVITVFYAFPGFVAGLAGASPDQPLDLLFIVIFLVPIDAVDDLLTGLCAAFTDSRTIFIRRYLLSPGLRIGVALTLVLMGADVRLLAYGYVVSGILGIGYYAMTVFREIRARGLLDGSLERDIALPVREVLSYTVPVMAADWCGILMTTAGPLLLGYLSDMSAVALFQVVVPLVTLTKVVEQSFGVLFEPEASRLHARRDQAALDHLYWKAAVWVAVLTFPMFAVAFTAAEPLTVLLYGARYADAAPVLSLLALGMFLDSLFGFNAATLRVVGRVNSLVLVNLMAAALIVGLNLVLIPRYGALGAGIATGVAWAFHGVLKQFALHAVTGVRAFGTEYPGPYLAIACATTLLVLVRYMGSGDLVVQGMAIGASVIVVWLAARRHLSVGSTFPELARVPILREVLG